jgi:hypothetical protein
MARRFALRCGVHDAPDLAPTEELADQGKKLKCTEFLIAIMCVAGTKGIVPTCTMRRTIIVVGLMLSGAPVAAEEAIPLGDVAHIHGVAFDTRHPGELLLATHYGIYRTEGESLVRVVSEDGSDYMGFTTNPAHPNMLLASGHPASGGNLGVLVSEDGGITWSQRSRGASDTVDFHAMTVSRADSDTMYGLYGAIQVSRDGGMTWQVSGPAPDRTIDLAASAVDADTLYAGTVTGLAVSADAGASWQMWGEAVPMTMVETGSDGRIYAFYAGLGLVTAMPDATEWRLVNGELGAHDFRHLAVDPLDGQHLVAVTQDSLVLESRDGGTSWKPFDDL